MVLRLPADKSDSSRDANIKTLRFYKNNATTLPAQDQDQNQFIRNLSHLWGTCRNGATQGRTLRRQ